MQSKNEGRQKRHRRIRKQVTGTQERPRLSVFRSARHIYAQIVDDVTQKTILSASDLEAVVREASAGAKKKVRAKQVGEAVARKCLERGITKVVFDRGGYRYHGRVSALADGAREAGLKF